MSSRQEEKERRRQERLEREQAAKAAASHRRHLLYGAAGLASVLVVAAAAVLALGVLGGGGKSANAKAATNLHAKLPPAQDANLASAASAASCKLVNAPIEGNTHSDKEFKPSDYGTNPPTSGNHNPIWYQDGIYAPGSTPHLGMLVHPLEHGRIELQYRPGTPKATVDQLATLLHDSSSGYHMLLFQNTTQMPYAVAATAWGHYVGCPTMSPKVFDVLRDFRSTYIDKGPEIVP
jgi:Protein of unknown function (DUF3105)